MKQMRLVLIVMLISFGIAYYWENLPFISEPVHSVLTPTLGALLAYNHYIGMIFVAILVNLIITLLQKVTIDKETMKEVKAEQKEIKKEMKKYKDHPEKLMEINKRQIDLVFGKQLPLTMRPVAFTSIPIILLFRWFSDLYGAGGLFEGTVFLGFLQWSFLTNWLFFYIFLSIIFSTLFRKWFDVI
jgi:uncharacterized membrane protein (DUF106 family)